MKKKLKQIVSLLIVASVGLYASKSRTLEYVLISDKEKIGEITQAYVMQNKNLFIITHSKLKWSGGKDVLDIEESSIEKYKGLKTLIFSESYAMDYDEKVLYKTTFNEKDGAYVVVISGKEEMNTSAIALFEQYKQNLNPKNKPQIPLAIEEISNTKVELNAFDTTENIFAFYLRNYDSKKNISTLSFDELTIDEIKVSDLGMVELSIDDKVLLTQNYKLQIKDKKPTYLWIAEAKSAFPYVVRVKGSDESGEFELILKSIK